MKHTIKCPKCSRVLGDTTKSIDATINCKRCGAQRIKITIADSANYYQEAITRADGEKR